MKRFRFKKLDAFAQGLSSGNPAGYIDTEGKHVSEREMLRIAAELKGFVNEVGFATRQDGTWSLRYFSSECEVAFCGHATIAILYDLLNQDIELRKTPEVAFRVQAGRLKALNCLDSKDAVYIQAPPPQFLEFRGSNADILDALGLDSSDRYSTLPCALVDGGLRTLIVPMKGLEACLRLHPDQESLRRFCLKHEVDIVHVSTTETSGAADWRTRVFAPRFGYLEDPATGSGNAAFGYYLVRQGLWERPLVLEQGPSREHPNIVRLRRSVENGEDRMFFGGAAIVRIEGEYLLQE